MDNARPIDLAHSNLIALLAQAVEHPDNELLDGVDEDNNLIIGGVRYRLDLTEIGPAGEPRS